MKGFFHFGRSELIVTLIFSLFLAGAVGLFYLFPVANAKEKAVEIQEITATSPQPELPLEQSSDKKKNKARPDSLIKSEDYVGPPIRQTYTPREKLSLGQSLDLNKADSAKLTLVPGIGPAFASRIVKLRSRLGGYYSILQLQEVYGMDRERFEEIRKYFRLETAQRRLELNKLQPDSLPKHPYLNYKQRSAIRRILARDGQIASWSQLLLLPEFNPDDSLRLAPYFTLN